MATANASTTFLENRLLSFIFKNNAASFSTPGDGIYVGLATAVSAAETGSFTEANFTNYARQQVTAANWTTIGEIQQIHKLQLMQRILSFQPLVEQATQ